MAQELAWPTNDGVLYPDASLHYAACCYLRPLVRYRHWREHPWTITCVRHGDQSPAWHTRVEAHAWWQTHRPVITERQALMRFYRERRRRKRHGR